MDKLDYYLNRRIIDYISIKEKQKLIYINKNYYENLKNFIIGRKICNIRTKDYLQDLTAQRLILFNTLSIRNADFNYRCKCCKNLEIPCWLDQFCI